jgi:hypothetical protein
MRPSNYFDLSMVFEISFKISKFNCILRWRKVNDSPNDVLEAVKHRYNKYEGMKKVFVKAIQKKEFVV